MGNPGFLEQLELKNMNLTIVLQFHKDVFKSPPFLVLETFNPQTLIWVTRPDIGFCLFLIFSL